MSLEELAKKDIKADEPIYSPPPVSSEELSKTPPLLQDLIILLWDRLIKIQTEIDQCDFEKHKVQLCLAMAAHARILGDLLKDSGLTREGREDLAKLLSKIKKRARREARKILWRKP